MSKQGNTGIFLGFGGALLLLWFILEGKKASAATTPSASASGVVTQFFSPPAGSVPAVAGAAAPAVYAINPLTDLIVGPPAPDGTCPSGQTLGMDGSGNLYCVIPGGASASFNQFPV